MCKERPKPKDQKKDKKPKKPKHSIRRDPFVPKFFKDVVVK